MQVLAELRSFVDDHTFPHPFRKEREERHYNAVLAAVGACWPVAHEREMIRPWILDHIGDPDAARLVWALADGDLDFLEEIEGHLRDPKDREHEPDEPCALGVRGYFKTELVPGFPGIGMAAMHYDRLAHPLPEEHTHYHEPRNGILIYELKGGTKRFVMLDEGEAIARAMLDQANFIAAPHYFLSRFKDSEGNELFQGIPKEAWPKEDGE